MVPTDVDALFKPTSASVRQLLSDLVGGFSIPSYQRPYRWMPADMRRLCEDMIAGLDRLSHDSSAVAFIGAIITVSGAGDEHPTLPSDPRRVIDGQQRLTTIVMLSIALHERIGLLSKRCLASNSGGLDDWFAEQCSEARSQLKQCLVDSKSYGEDGYRELPKLTRGITDRWGNKAETARYLSPVANLIHGYCRHDGASAYAPKQPTMEVKPESTGSSPADFDYLHLRYTQMKRLVSDMARGAEGDLADIIDINSVLEPHSSVMSALFQSSDQQLTPKLRVLARADEDIAATLRILLITKFMLERVAITQINAKDESYAFDLFDSLNTTGEPLTAFETFVPLVVQAEKVDDYPTSPSFEHISLTSRLISSDEGNVQRQTERLITSYLLGEAGLKVPSKHNEQRRELTRLYRSTETMDQRRAMTRQLADAALCYFHMWQRVELSRGATGVEGTLDNASRFALRFLNKINHTIALAPLSRYFGVWAAAPNEETKAALEAAIRASTAFSVLWRTAHGGTDGIDSVYRRLTASGVPDVCQPLSRTNGKTHDVRTLPPVQDLIGAYRFLLSDSEQFAVTDQTTWIAHSQARPIYDDQAELSRFLLLLAGHQAVADGLSGLTKDGLKADHTSMLTPARYTADDRLATVEHVAPQSPSASWDSSIYMAPSAVSFLGNLTLLPLDDNSFISNRDWEDKRAIYGALSCNAPDEARVILTKAVSAGLVLPDGKMEYIVNRRQHLPMLSSISAFGGTWDRSFIENRTSHLLERAWGILDSWLTAPTSL